MGKIIIRNMQNIIFENKFHLILSQIKSINPNKINPGSAGIIDIINTNK